MTSGQPGRTIRRARKELEILLVSVFLFGVVVREVRRSEWDGGRWPVRALATAASVAIAAGSAFWLHHLLESSDTYRLAYLLTGTIFIGAVTYAFGTALGRVRAALPARWLGWIGMAAPLLLVPSTFSLFLPVVAALAVTLRPFQPGSDANRVRPQPSAE